MIHGFELLREELVPEYGITARLYKHAKTGGQALSLVCDDENKVFGISLRTPPHDSTGVAHILEHSVLCGSRKYPVKEPFVELLKGSLQTFLNAFTYPDKTCYPVASANLQDFYNLIDVYLDAVFYPRLTPHIFAQEGWHYELDDPSQPLTYKGVVFNEMKGAYSSPDSVLAEKSQQSLFPDTTYGLDSGGDPKKIPDLTFEAFMDFHRRYYHPSNARAFFYGDDDPDERLRILDAYFREFEPLKVDSSVKLQQPFQEPKRVNGRYAAGEDQSDKGMITMNWLLPEATDVEMAYLMDILEFILIGLPASPLRKALIDSGLGEDLAGTGLEAELRQMYFSTGLKGVDLAQADKVEKLILDTMTGLARDGIAPDMVEAAVNIIEFGLRENNTGSFPRGLSLMLRSLSSWLYDGDPFAPMRFEDNFARIKARLASGEKLFEELLSCLLLENPHRTTLVLAPDTGLAAKTDREEAQVLARLKESLSKAEQRRIADETAYLKQLQAAPDAPEDLAKIPTLAVADLPRENKLIPLEEREPGGVKTLFHDLPTSSILYLDLGFDLHALPRELLPMVPLFGRALLEMGTAKEDYVTFLQRIARKTGGVRRETLTSHMKARSGSAAWLFLRGKSTMENAGELLAILHDALLEARLDDRDRFRQMLLEAKARQEQRIVPAGHQIVSMRLRARFSESDSIAEDMHGVSNLFWTRSMLEAVDRDWDRVRGSLEAIRSMLLKREAMVVNVTLDRGNYERFEPELARFLAGMPEGGADRHDWGIAGLPSCEGLTIPAQVNYVGKGADLYKAGYSFHGSAQVITRYLRTAYLWERVRVQGGAYGAFCTFDRLSGVFSFVSYRDPNIVSTLKAYDGTADFLDALKLSEDELTKSIVGAIGDIDTYMLPDAKGFASLARYLWGETDADRQRVRDEVLGTTSAHFRSFADVLRQVAAKGETVVLASSENLKDASSGMVELREGMRVTKVL